MGCWGEACEGEVTALSLHVNFHVFPSLSLHQQSNIGINFFFLIFPHQVTGFAVQTEVNGCLLVPKTHCFLFEELGLCGTGKLSPSWSLQGLLGSRALLGSPCQRTALELSSICDIPATPSVLPITGNA